MASDGQVVFEITSDDSKLKQNIRQTTSQIQQESKKWEKAGEEAANNTANAWSSAIAKITGAFAAAKVVNLLKEWGTAAIDAASDLAEVQNVVDTVFGDGASKIESWAKKAGTQFGLTETQAKKFTSTLGAMMKSSGLSGNQIVEMSTDLAGLAADMASFYNLDFDTAFQKIRSGISGETEPLKQLGINMSTANLNAFALQQGITKTFEKMSQGEQTLLRYQYIMQATADAQGDFAKTADGYANAQRRITTALDTINTNVGGFLLTTIEPFVTGLASILEKLTATPEETLFDKIAAINLDTEAKIAEIEKTAETAQGLIDKLNVISGTDAGDALKKLAEGANTLDASAASTWKAILASLKDIDGLQNIFSNTSAGDNIEKLAGALSGSEISTDKAAAWKEFLGALSENADAVSKLTGSSIDETKAWLESLSDAVNSIDAGDAEAWNKLLSTLVTGFSADTPDGQKFMEGLAAQFLALGSESDVASSGLQSLGFSTDQIADKQEEWLKTCKQLVQTIPGLSEVINTETGEVTGGIGALNKYVSEWKEAQEKLVYWKAYYAKVSAQQEQEASLYQMRIIAGGAEVAVKNQMEHLDQLRKELGISGSGYDMVIKTNATGGQGVLTAAEKQWNDEVLKLGQKRNEAAKAEDAYTKAVEENSKVIEQNSNENQWLLENIGELTEEEIKAGDAAEDFGNKSAAAWQTATSDAKEAIKAVADYYQKMRDATEKTVEKVVGGFGKVKGATDNASKKLAEQNSKEQEALKKYDSTLKKWRNGDGSVDLKKMSEHWDKLTKKEKEAYNELAKIKNKQTELNESLSEYSLEGIKGNLESQKQYMTDYVNNLNQLREWGVSDQTLAALADGSAESAEYLAGLVAGGKEGAQEVDRLFKEVEEQRKQFTDTLTQQQLTVDETYNKLVEKAQKAIGELDLGQEAAEAMGNTVSGLAQGIKSHVGEVSAAVDDIEAQLKRLSKWNVNVSLGMFGSLSFAIDGEHETGLNFVPFDGYLASLHEGEGILTAEENRVWQRFKNGQPSQGVDYDMLGGTMRDNIKAGGNVYLDGRTVGRVISDQQGKSFRALERSGWQG